MRYTKKGRVVYKRKTHFLEVRDVVRQLEKLSVSKTKEELAQNPYICNTLFEIVRTAFYPTWQRASAIREPGQLDTYFYSKIEPVLREQWKNIAFEVCITLGKDLGIPDYVIDFVMKYITGAVWDLVWSITDPFFHHN